MNQATEAQFEAQLAIVNCAVSLFTEDPAQFNRQRICECAGVAEKDFEALVGSEIRALGMFYPLAVAQYRRMIAQMSDYNDMTLAEKLATFLYIMLDILNEQRAFVAATFPELRRQKNWRNAFEDAVMQAFRDILERDSGVAMLQRQLLLNRFTYSLLVSEFFGLIDYWLEDDSENFAKTMAYIDKLVNFFAELLAFSAFEKGVDLAKFVVQHNLNRLPIINRFIKNTEQQ
jgi:hypothetical protein